MKGIIMSKETKEEKLQEWALDFLHYSDVNVMTESDWEQVRDFMELKRISEEIHGERDISWGELAFLQNHKKEIFMLDDIVLAEWAGISESEWNRRK